MANAEAALVRIDQALALAAETGEHWTDAFLHRIRGEALLKRHPANTAPAEEAFLTAIAIAQQQKARSFELQAVLSLAKLYQSTNRNVDAHGVLAAAFDGFSPTPEFPEIEKAQRLLAKLTELDEVKGATAARERRLKLQTAYGLAMSWSKGFAAEETKAAFARARELSVGTENLDQRFTTLYGQWITSLTGGEIGRAQEVGEIFLREAQKAERMPETLAALRYLGLTHLSQGHFLEARTHLEQVLRSYDPSRDRDASFRFGTDSLASATIYLAFVCWQLGDFRRARELGDEAVARAVDSGHDATLANVLSFKAVFEMGRDDAEATLHAAQSLGELSQRLKLPNYVGLSAVYSAWAGIRLRNAELSIAGLRQAMTAHMELGSKLRIPFLLGKLAEAEAGRENAQGALFRIDEALMLSNETEQYQDVALLHRLRGEILLKLDPANIVPAEGSFLSAITIAQQQGARTYQLKAALSLAKLYQSTGRAADAHAVLVSALHGLTPTPELPEIGDAEALLDTLGA
jgi:predicted ATPase